MSKSLDRLTLLQTFVRIADAGSISAAARDLGLSQPSVSRQLAELYLLDTVIQFQQQHPEITLSWLLQDGHIRFAEVGCDCWVKIGPVADESLIVEPLGEVERIAVAAPELMSAHSTPKTPADLEKIHCIALAPFEGGRIPFTNTKGKKVVIAPPIRMTTNNISAVRKATLAGLGWAVMPRWFIEDELNNQQLVDLLPSWRAPRLTIRVASLPGRHRPRRLQSFLDVLKTTVPKIPGIEPLSRSNVHLRKRKP